MCLLIVSINGDPLPLSVFENATSSNRDGFGIAYPSDNGVKIAKFLSLDPESQYLLTKKISKYGPYIVHWRYGTSGGSKRRLAHPFRISGQCALAHNGVMSVNDQPNEESDTSWLAAKLRDGGVKTAAGAIAAIGRLPSHITGGSKFAAISHDGKIYIHNAAAGIRVGNIWHSNGCGLNGSRSTMLAGTKSSGYVGTSGGTSMYATKK